MCSLNLLDGFKERKNKKIMNLVGGSVSKEIGQILHLKKITVSVVFPPENRQFTGL